MKKLLLIVALGMFGIGPLPAAIIGPEPLLVLMQSADLIVLGSAAGTIEEPASGAFTIKVTRVIKGPAAIAGTVIDVLWHETNTSKLALSHKNLSFSVLGGERPVSNGPVSASGEGIWFLQRPLNSWVLLPVYPGTEPFEWMYYPAPLSLLPDVYTYAANASITDKLASELAAAIEGVPPNFFDIPFSFLYNGGLDELNSPVIGILYQRLSVSPERERRQGGSRALERIASKH